MQQLQKDLKSRTHFSCGLDLIQSEEKCESWVTKNTHFYNDESIQKRILNCSTYFDTFYTAARRPVIFKKQYPFRVLSEVFNV